MANLWFEPDSIRLHCQTVDVFGSEPQLFETRPPELSGTLRGEKNGIHGTVTVTLDEAESQFIREVIRSAGKRAIGLLREGVTA